MADFFKSLEPVDFHNLQNKLAELKPYKLPSELLEFLQGSNLHFHFGEKANEKTHSMDCEYIDFLSITDTMPMKAGRQKLLRISRKIDNYDSTHIVWNPKTKRIVFYDDEHDELGDVVSFDDFINDLPRYIQKIINTEI